MTKEESLRIAREVRSKRRNPASREQDLMSRQMGSTIRSALPAPKPVVLSDSIPTDDLLQWGSRLYLLMNLTWSYIDTILDLCIQQRIADTKPLVRQIRDIRRRYDRFRQKSIDLSETRKETQSAETFEEAFSADFDRLFNGLELETGKLDLTEGRRTLLIATNQALTLMDTVKMYARWCDTRISALGIVTADCALLQTEFAELYPLIHKFAGDCHDPHSKTRRLTAEILLNRIKNIKLNIVY